MDKYPHGKNIETKLKREKIPENIELLNEIKEKYREWKRNNEKIKGTSKEDIFKKVGLLNEYKNFIDQPKFKKEKGQKFGFTFQSKLHSTVIEEFLFYLFKDMDIIKNRKIILGPAKAYVDMSFSPKNIKEWEINPGVDIKVKDQDFAIGKEIFCIFSSTKEIKNKIEKTILVPIIAIECKTYLDKTMLDGASYAAERLKRGNPYALYIVLTETNALDKNVNPKHTQIDEIFVLRRQRASERILRPIDKEIIWELFNFVKSHLEKEWWNPEEATGRGRLIG
jgi:hypothetical protein